MSKCFAIASALLCAALAAPEVVVAAGCPTEPGWNYTDEGPSVWGTLFPVLCGVGVRQSPIDIVTRNVVRTNLPKLRFHYNVGDVVTLDHDDQTLHGHGAGNFITIGTTEYLLDNIHAHTPSEHTLNGQSFPLELHFVHVSEAGQIAVVGVLVKAGKPDKGVIEGPSNADPSEVDFKLTDLIPENHARFTYDGSLTTPGPDPTTVGCPETVLWMVMRHPIQMSSDQIQAFQDSGFACWGTNVTARPVQPVNNRLIFGSPPPSTPPP